MKKLVFLLMCIVPLCGYTQAYDRIWLAGNANLLGDSTHGGIVLDFNSAPRKVYYQYRDANLFIANASICDTSGNLLFYTNGCNVYGNDHEILPNGEELNPGFFHETRCNQFNRGYGGGFPNVVILPFPGRSDKYCLFHQKVGGQQQNLYVDQLLYSVVEQSSNGQLAVTDKNVEMMGGALAAGELAAVKHANGTDWWVITPRRNSNEFYCFLFTQDGVVDTLKQTIGDVPMPQEEARGQTSFTADGTRMVRYFPLGGVMLYDFDRGTGRFSNFSTFKVDYGNDLVVDGGLGISPSGRFIYVVQQLQVYQFDLQASGIASTQIKVVEWDGFKDPIAVSFGDCQLGPDCKLYCKSGDMRYYHIIHDPDKAGLACNFEQRGLVLPTPSGASIPYFPNYRLGPAGNPGVPCSPTVSVGAGPVREVEAVRVWPNPASDHLSIQFSAPDEEGIWQIVGMGGQVLRSGRKAGGESLLLQPLEHLPSGLYGFQFQSESGKTVARRFVVLR